MRKKSQTKNFNLINQIKNKSSGITLIALVVTIVVLLILAAVSISTLGGENGIIAQAQSARENMNKSGAVEKVQTELLASYDETGTLSKDNFQENIQKNLDINTDDIKYGNKGTATIKVDQYEVFVDLNEKKVEIKENAIPGIEVTKLQKDNYRDQNNKTATIPVGFTVDVEENTIDTGLVVKGPDGSEFIWVPVDDINSMAQCSSAGGNCKLELENGQLKCITKEHSETANIIVGKLYAKTMGENFGTIQTTYNRNDINREPALASDYDNNPEYNTVGLTFENLKKEYKTMAESVAKYGGFYIGRYESSLSDATESESGQNGTIQSKKGVMISRAGDGATNKWYGLYAKQKEYTGKNNSVGSSMIWGSQYDAMINWVINSNSPDKDKVKSTGNAAHNLSGMYPSGTQTVNGKFDRINNIYDLEGNAYEWTLETYGNTSRVFRGSFCAASSVNGKVNSPSNRDYNGARYSTNTMGSRMTLYIND